MTLAYFLHDWHHCSWNTESVENMFKKYFRLLKMENKHIYSDLPAEGCQEAQHMDFKDFPSKLSHITYALSSGQKKLLKYRYMFDNGQKMS